MHRTVAFSAGFLVLAAAIFISTSSAEEEQAKPVDNPFAGKFVTVYLNGPSLESGQILKDAELVEIGGRMMLVGIGAKTGQEGEWAAGIPVGVAWESVAIYYLMTEEQFEAKLQKHAR